MNAGGMSPIRLVAALLLAVGLVFIRAPAAVAAPVLDQSFFPIDGVNDFTRPTGCGLTGLITFCGQSFTVGLTGTLTSVGIYIEEVSGSGGTPGLTPIAGVYDISGGGLTLLGFSPTVAAESPFPGLTFFSFNIPVTVGDELAILFQVVDAVTHLVLDGEDAVGALNYPGGFIRVTDPPVVPGRTDFYFQTFVDSAAVAVPQADTALMVGLGMLSLLAGRGLGSRRRS